MLRPDGMDGRQALRSVGQSHPCDHDNDDGSGNDPQPVKYSFDHGLNTFAT